MLTGLLCAIFKNPYYLILIFLYPQCTKEQTSSAMCPYDSCGRAQAELKAKFDHVWDLLSFHFTITAPENKEISLPMEFWVMLILLLFLRVIMNLVIHWVLYCWKQNPFSSDFPWPRKPDFPGKFSLASCVTWSCKVWPIWIICWNMAPYLGFRSKIQRTHLKTNL